MPTVGAQVLEQPPHEAGVICFAKNFFFVHKSMKYEKGKIRD
jgi:hypothetical protein